MVSVNPRPTLKTLNNVMYLGNFIEFCYLVIALDWCSTLIKTKAYFEQCIFDVFSSFFENMHCWKYVEAKIII